MNEQEATELLSEKLSSQQKVAMSSIWWFFYGSRGTGRTYPAVTVALIQAMRNPDIEVEVTDHYSHSYDGRYIKD